MKERIDYKNNNIKHLVITNGFEWYFFKAEDFYDTFYKNKELVKEYGQFRDKLKDSSKNELFYDEIAKKYIAKVENQIPFVYVDFKNKSIFIKNGTYKSERKERKMFTKSIQKIL